MLFQVRVKCSFLEVVPSEVDDRLELGVAQLAIERGHCRPRRASRRRARRPRRRTSSSRVRRSVAGRCRHRRCHHGSRRSSTCRAGRRSPAQSCPWCRSGLRARSCARQRGEVLRRLFEQQQRHQHDEPDDGDDLGHHDGLLQHQKPGKLTVLEEEQRARRPQHDKQGERDPADHGQHPTGRRFVRTAKTFDANAP